MGRGPPAAEPKASAAGGVGSVGRSGAAAGPKAPAAGPVGKGGDRGILFPLTSSRAGAAAIGCEGAA
eukprot:4006347-Prorocentrum_lima.AAC.1